MSNECNNEYFRLQFSQIELSILNTNETEKKVIHTQNINIDFVVGQVLPDGVGQFALVRADVVPGRMLDDEADVLRVAAVVPGAVQFDLLIVAEPLDTLK